MDLSERGAGATQRHPWETARADFFLGLLRQRSLLSHDLRWLDVGAGDGWLTNELAEASTPGSSFVCWDINYDDQVLSAMGPTSPAVTFASEEPDSDFDALLLLDVIEHVEDDQEFLSGLVSRRLRPGGTTLVSVPAWQALFSQHDVALSHHRRYSPAQMRSLIWQAGLVVEAEGGLFHGLLLPRTVQVALERLGHRSPSTGIGSWDGGPGLTRSVSAALRADTWVSRRLSDSRFVLPGLSYWALCRKP
jgi:SAM-dependent methyltransferase